jgi:putative SOS response-associated peptidase YedK
MFCVGVWCRSGLRTSTSVFPISTPKPRGLPYAITLADQGIMALAGLWENWRSPAGEWVRSFAVITTTPNALCAELHDRMPVVLGPQVWPEWLGEEPADPARLKVLLAPYPAEEMTCWPVSTRVGNVKNNDPSLIEPVALAG